MKPVFRIIPCASVRLLKIAETNANLEVIRYTNNAAGDLLSLTDGKNQTTRWSYDEYGRVTNKLDQAGAEILRYRYDANSRLTNRWSAAKGNTGYTYDSVGNLTFVNYPTSTDVSFAYDPLNRLTNMVDAVGTTRYSYDAAGQLLIEDGPFAHDTITNTYVNRLRTKLDLQQPSGLWSCEFFYDQAKRLTNVTSPAGPFSYALGATAPSSSLIKKLLLPNTSYITNTYDAVARLTGTRLTKNDGTVLDSAGYGYNPAGQRNAMTNNISISFTNSYDPIGQLTTAEASDSDFDCRYAYDAAWNMSGITKGVLPDLILEDTYYVNVKNQITSTAESDSFTYDANGNMVTRWGGALVMAYDDENRLVARSVYFSDLGPGEEREDGDSDSTFTYDGLGRLRRSFVSVWGNCPDCEWVESSTTSYIYDGMLAIQDRDTNNTPVVSYTRGPDLSATMQGAGGIGGLLARSHGYSSGNWTTHNYYHADGNGNVTCLIDTNQALAAIYAYDPFGNTTYASGALAGENLYRFSSKQIDSYTGMYYYGYRWYDPSLQRWLNRDPMGEEGGINLFAFVFNSPVSFVDPFGEEYFFSPPLWPPPNPWPQHPGSVDADKGSVTIHTANAPAVRPAKPRRPCSPIGKTTASKPSSRTETKECPCTGTSTVTCTEYEQCVFWSMALNGQTQGTWETMYDCPCPEHRL